MLNYLNGFLKCYAKLAFNLVTIFYQFYMCYWDRLIYTLLRIFFFLPAFLAKASRAPLGGRPGAPRGAGGAGRGGARPWGGSANHRQDRCPREGPRLVDVGASLQVGTRSARGSAPAGGSWPGVGGLERGLAKVTDGRGAADRDGGAGREPHGRGAQQGARTALAAPWPGQAG